MNVKLELHEAVDAPEHCKAFQEMDIKSWKKEIIALSRSFIFMLYSPTHNAVADFNKQIIKIKINTMIEKGAIVNCDVEQQSGSIVPPNFNQLSTDFITKMGLINSKYLGADEMFTMPYSCGNVPLERVKATINTINY
tara:strand:+ start:122 stop:535 length:414 start_codon:yes stop_codon:yes gene_type:complete